LKFKKGQKLLFFAPIFFAVTYAQSNQPTNQSDQPTNQPNQPTNQPTDQSTNQPSNQPANRNCRGKPHQPGLRDSSTDFWIEEKGNKYVLQAINAAMFEINKDNNWRRMVTELGGNVITTENVAWPPSSGAKGTFEYMMTTRKIRFGSTLTFFPFSTNDTGCINGTEIDLANMIAHQFTKQYAGTPFEASWVQIDRTGDFWYDIAYALSGDQSETNDHPPIDVILSTVTKTAEREAGGMARFTSSYLKQQYGIVLSDEGKRKGITLSNLDNAEHKIAVGIGSTNEAFVTETYPNISVLLCENISQRMDAVKMDQSDAAIGDATYIKNWARMNHQEYLGSVGDFTELAMAVRPAKQPSAKPTVKVCKMTANPTSSTLSKYCYEKASSFCTSCPFYKDSCYRLVQEKREGDCCRSSSCCKTRRNGRCTYSVTKKGSVQCKTTYVVQFDAEGTNDFTEKTVRNIVLKQCGTSKKCVDDLLKNSTYQKDQNVPCTVSSNGNIELPELDLLVYSSASYRFISSYSILFLFVWSFSS